MDHKAVAEVLFASGLNCAQAVFVAFCDETGVDRETAIKISASFGGGMGKLREVCGAVTGAFAVAGALWGPTDPTDNNAKSEHYALIRRIAEEFNQKHGTYICNYLLKGIASAQSKDPQPRTEEYYKIRPCARFVATAAEILDKIIEEKREDSAKTLVTQ